VDLPAGYASFINAMKKAHPDKRLVFNAVSSYGSNRIAATGNVDFCYNEVWSSEEQFSDLYTIIKTNDMNSNHTLKSIFAAYMNYECSNREFNIPGVLLTDAVIFALGGAHLELGDHMLCREYFPSQEVKMSQALKTLIVRYYDFMTAYQNLLRGASSKAEVQVEVTSTATNTGAMPLRAPTKTSPKMEIHVICGTRSPRIAPMTRPMKILSTRLMFIHF
jgi:dextranase